MGILEIIGTPFVVVGCVLALTGSLGVLRMPDFYSRLHPAGKSDTLAQACILFGLALFAGQQLITVLGAEHSDHGSGWIGPANIILKLLLLTALLFLTAPTATHAIAKAARLDRHTDLPVEDDPSGSRIGTLQVEGDVHERLEEASGPLLDVREESADELARPPDDDDEPGDKQAGEPADNQAEAPSPGTEEPA